MLPPERRQDEGIPVSVTLTSVCALGLGIICVAAFLWLTAQARVINMKRAAFENSQRRHTELVDEKNSLDGTIGVIRNRRDTILDIRKNRILWAKKLNRLARKTPQDIVWWKSARMKQTGTAFTIKSGSLAVECIQADPDIEKMGMYREAISDDKMFWRDFASMSLPGCIRDKNDMFHYTLTFYLKPRGIPVAVVSPHGIRKGGRR